MDNGASGSTEVNTSTSSVELVIVTLPKKPMMVHEPQEQATTVSSEKKSERIHSPRRR